MPTQGGQTHEPRPFPLGFPPCAGRAHRPTPLTENPSKKRWAPVETFCHPRDFLLDRDNYWSYRSGSMLLSRTAEYALRAMTFLAMQPAGKLAGARAISEAESIPIPFLWKILHTLARQRLVRSFKGIHGGYELARPSNEITLHSVVLATDGSDFGEHCVLGLPRCGEENACPLHDTWKGIRGQMTDMLVQTTLADLAKVAQRRKEKSKVHS